MAEPRVLSHEVHRRLDETARRSPELRDALEVLAGIGDDRPDRERLVVHAARTVNARRGAGLRQRFIAGALTSPEVSELLGGVDRQAVAARRSRRTLLGWTIGNTTHHPDWQFDASGELPGLGKVVRALHAVTSSPLAADQLMRAPRDDLGGSSLAQLLADGRAELVVRLLTATDA